MKYNVHVFVAVRVKVPGVESESQEQATKKAYEKLSGELHGIFDGDHVYETEVDEAGAVYFLVDEDGDEEYENSIWYQGNVDYKDMKKIGG